MIKLDGVPCRDMTLSKNVLAIVAAVLSGMTRISAKRVSWSMKVIRYLLPNIDVGSVNMSEKTLSHGLLGMA